MTPDPSSPVPRVIDSSFHCCECACVHCERNGTGLFAQLAALDGDASAARHFRPELAAFLATEAAQRKALSISDGAEAPVARIVVLWGLATIALLVAAQRGWADAAQGVARWANRPRAFMRAVFSVGKLA